MMRGLQFPVCKYSLPLLDHEVVLNVIPGEVAHDRDQAHP